MKKIIGSPDLKVVMMTGAGISAESGIKTFREADGLWENHRIEDVASPYGFRADPLMVWTFYMARRKQSLECQPNPGHIAIAGLEKFLVEGGGSFLLVTQNVDGLHKRAGSMNIIEIHGSLIYSRCTGCGEVFLDKNVTDDLPPYHHCGEKKMLRPHIVWFGESLFPGDIESVEQAVRNCDVYISSGTSGVVYPAAGFASFAASLGKRTVCVNKEPPANVDVFDEYYEGESGKLLPDILF